MRRRQFLLLFGDTRDTTYRYNMHDIIHLAPCADRLERGTFMLHPLEAYKRVGKRTSDKTSCWMLTCECAVCVNRDRRTRRPFVTVDDGHQSSGRSDLGDQIGEYLGRRGHRPNLTER